MVFLFQLQAAAAAAPSPNAVFTPDIFDQTEPPDLAVYTAGIYDNDVVDSPASECETRKPMHEADPN